MIFFYLLGNLIVSKTIFLGGFFMKIRDFRLKLGLSQREVSEKLNIPQTTLFSYETDTNEPNIQTLIKLADFYHVSLDELVGRPTNIINKMVLTEREQSIIEKVLNMNNKQQELTELYIDTMLNNL